MYECINCNIIKDCIITDSYNTRLLVYEYSTVDTKYRLCLWWEIEKMYKFENVLQGSS